MERWAAGDAYEHYMGRWSRTTAKGFLAWLQPTAHATWLDVGCGTGALTSAAAASAPSAPAIGAIGMDPSLNFVQYAHQHTAHATFAVADARALPVHDSVFDYVISGLALNFVPQPEQALREFVRVAKAGGVVAAYVWDYAGKMEFLRYFWDAAAAVDIHAKTLHEGYRFPLCAPQPLQQLWQDAALNEVVVHPLDIVTRFDDFDAYWQLFTRGNFPAPHYALSLDTRMRANLCAQLQGTLPIAEDGSIQLIARAWAVRGTKAP